MGAKIIRNVNLCHGSVLQRKKCPSCGGYMLEKGNKLVCADEHCGYVMAKPKENDDNQ